MPERFHDFNRRKWPPARDVQKTNSDAVLLANVVHRGFRSLDHASQSDDRVIRIFQTVRHHDVVSAASQPVIFVHHPFQGGQHPIVEFALGDLALHVAVLVLNYSRHQRNSGIEQRTSALRRVSDKLPH